MPRASLALRLPFDEREGTHALRWAISNGQLKRSTIAHIDPCVAVPRPSFGSEPLKDYESTASGLRVGRSVQTKQSTYGEDAKGVTRHSPDSRPVERDFSFHRGTPQRNSAATNPVGSQIVRFPDSQGRNSWLGLHQGTPLPSSSVVSDPIARSCRCRQRPQPGDQRQDFWNICDLAANEVGCG